MSVALPTAVPALLFGTQRQVKRDSEGFIEIPPVAHYAKPYRADEIRDFVTRLVQTKPKNRSTDWKEQLENLLKPNKHLALFSTQPQGLPFPWMFAHRPGDNLNENAIKGAVHALTLVKGPDGQPHVFLLITKRPPLGGDDPHAVFTLETPAGIWGDKDSPESGLEAANREVKEETGKDPKNSTYMIKQKFAATPGGFSEAKIFVQTLADGQSNRDSLVISEAEDRIIVGKLLVPLETFENTKAFKQWLTEMDQQNLMVGLDVVAARGLMDDDTRDQFNALA